MAHSIFVALFFAFLTRAAGNFPCEQITSATDFDCDDVGWCYSRSGACVEDTCIKTASKSGSCDDGCSKRHLYYDWDCETNRSVNESGFYCAESYNYLRECFYNGTLTGGSCGKGCKTVTLGGKSVCIRDDDYDECNDFDSEASCHFNLWCFWQNGKCSWDQCINDIPAFTVDCFPRTSCTARDVYFYEDGEYVTLKICLNSAHTTYQKCFIDITESVPNGIGDCSNTTFHNELCTGQAGCKVVTFEGEPVCSSVDPSSFLVVRVPSVFVLLAVVLTLFFIL